MGDAQPFWVGPAGSILRRLPRARFRALELLCSSPPAPFSARVFVAGTTFTFSCDLRDSKQRAVCFLGSYEPQETFLFRHLVKPGTTVVDLGANWGYFTMIAAALTGPSGRVVSLEPDIRMYTTLTQNLSENGFVNVTALPLAAAAEECTLRLDMFDITSSNWGVSRLIFRDNPGSGTRVKCAPLDKVLDELSIAVADLTKIDVEGAEEEVLRGMHEGLSAHRYRSILLELHPTILDHAEEAIRDMIGLLMFHHYRGYWIDHSPAITRKMSYGRAVQIFDFLLPLEARTRWDLWPHMVWLAPGVVL